MTAGILPETEPAPRRGRPLIPAAVPRRAELIAGAAVTVVLAHLLLAQLTLVLALLFAAVSRTARWRPWWLLAPAAAGLAWTLAAGPEQALAGFAAGPAALLAQLGGIAAPGHSPGALPGTSALSGIGGWLPRQLPVALPLAAAEAALLGWLRWLHTDEWAVPSPRPGAVAALRTAVASRAVRAGAVLTRDGCALGIVPGTGAVAELRWAEMAGGSLVAGAAEREVTLACLQVVHAALRRRKPVIVLDGPDTPVGRALMAGCRATGTPLLGDTGDTVHTWETVLSQAISGRAAVLLPTGTPELAARACAELTALAADLRRIGVDGDALVWVPHGDRMPGPALAGLLHAGAGAGLAPLIGTTSPAAAAELCELAGTTLVCRVADPELAARLAAQTGTWLLPPSVAAARDGRPPATSPPDLVRCPVVPARELLTLGPADFVLARGGPRRRLVTRGQLVPGRLPAPRVRDGATA